jgi:hypothetical protein
VSELPGLAAPRQAGERLDRLRLSRRIADDSGFGVPVRARLADLAWSGDAVR